MKRVITSAKKLDTSKLENEIWAELGKYMTGPKGGFDDDEWKDYTRVEIKPSDDGRTEVQVRSEFLADFDDAIEVSEKLDKIIEKYDKDAYFDIEDAGIIVAYIER